MNTRGQINTDNNPTLPALADAMQALYDKTRARMGEEDVQHIRNVAAYSQAIKARSRELIQKGGKDDALMRGVVLYMLHVLLEFSELGHNILHGSYDNLPNAEEFHSDRWQWDFVTDIREWKVMHHQNHHPFTNIINKDHDLGYSIARLYPNQDWFAHHGAQPALIALLLLHVYHFSVYTATSAARVEGRKVWSRETFKETFSLIRKHAAKNYIEEPLSAGPRFLHTLVGNYLGTALGYDLTILILALEHHAPNVKLFPDPGPTESRDDYFRRQILGTTNFIPLGKLDAFFQRILSEEIDFASPPPFEVFYGGLTTHIEHHLFPDLPCNRQREIAPRVRELCLQYQLPYNVVSFDEVVPGLLKSLIRWTIPANELEQNQPLTLLRMPRKLLNRVLHGIRYRSPSPTTYFKATRFYNVSVKVQEVTPLIGGEAIAIKLAKPKGWEDIYWDAGAFVSLRIPIGGEELVRQYSLTSDSEAADTLNISVKRVTDGRVSNYLNDYVRAGNFLTLVGPPQNADVFTHRQKEQKALFLAGGVGITPIISMLRKMARAGELNGSTLLYFNRNADSIIFEQELRVIAAQSGLELHICCDEPVPYRCDLGHVKLSETMLATKVPDIAQRRIYACAPPGFLEIAGQYLQALGVPSEHYHTESFTPPKLQRPAVNSDIKHQIRFNRSAIAIDVDGSTTLLEAARQAGLRVPAGCEQGLCKACVCTKLSGITQHEETSGQRLTRITVCNSLPRSDMELDL